MSLPGSMSFFDFPTEGSAIKQTVNVQAGDVLSFDWNFLSNDSSNLDYGFVMLDGVTKLADTTASLVNSSTAFSQETGFQSFTHTFDSAGSYSLALGVIDAGDFNASSALLVDNVQVESVPESRGVVGVLALGVLGMGATLKQKREKGI